MKRLCFPLWVVLSVCLGACAARTAKPVAPGNPPVEAKGASEPRGIGGASAGAASSVERIYQLAATPGVAQRGRDDAKVTVEICSDFECPFCARLVPTLHELEENYGDLVRVLWRDCPLPFHEHALPAAEAAREVLVQGGPTAFWAYHDRLFEHQDALSADALAEHAKAIAGIDSAKVLAALQDHRHVAVIRAELTALVDSGATSRGFGTPAAFINGRLLSGAQPYDAFELAVERALAETPEQRAAAVAASETAYPMARARHVMVQWKGAEGAEPSVVRTKEEAFKLATELQTRIVRDHADFGVVAREGSDCPSAPQGGELGRVTRGEFVPEFEAVLFTLAPNEVSSVVETPFGYHIIQREE